MPVVSETTLTLSDVWLTTQTSVAVRGRTETGSMPTGISSSRTGAEGTVTSNTDANGGRLTNQRATTAAYNSAGLTQFGDPTLSAWDTIVGIVSRASYVTGNKKAGIAFWSVYLPGTR